MAKYDDLLTLDNKLKTLQIHLQFLAIEIYKSKISCEILYLLRTGIFLSVLNVNTQKYGINSLSFRGSVLRNSLPIKFKKCKFLQELCFNKLLLKQSENLPCTCSVCKK